MADGRSSMDEGDTTDRPNARFIGNGVSVIPEADAAALCVAEGGTAPDVTSGRLSIDRVVGTTVDRGDIDVWEAGSGVMLGPNTSGEKSATTSSPGGTVAAMR